jgi:branched-chain amino acid aminotransferase
MAEDELMKFAYFHTKIVPLQDATINIASHSLQYGTTCFGGIRGYYESGKAKLFRLQDHFERLINAAKILGMKTKMSWEEFEAIVVELVQANAPQTDFYLRPFFYSEDQVLTPCFDQIDFRLAIYMTPLGHYFDPHRGLALMVSSWRKVSDAAMPTKAKAGGCYVNSALAKSEATQNGYDDALMMDDQGNVVEASAANIFLVLRGEVIMPETGSAMLEGITRRTVIDFLEEENIKVRAERIDRSMIYICDELIVTGTAAQVTFAESVDGRKISQDGEPGPICELLRNKLKKAIEGEHPKSSLWLTEIPI